MKIPTQVLIGSVSLFQLAAAQVDATPFGYTNFLRQFQLPGGTVEVIQRKSISSSGSTAGVAFTAVGGMRYDLWTVKNTQQGLVETFLATTTVDLFKPSATITIRSGDPYNDPTDARYPRAIGPRRTRADEAFTVTSVISGLEQDQTKSECFRMVNSNRTIQPYGIAKMPSVPYQLASVGQPVRILSRNETYTFNYGTALRGPDGLITTACGEEVFTVTSLKDTSLTEQTIPVRVLDTKTIQVWPVSSGEVLPYPGQGTPFQEPVPPITFRAFDLYPRSDTYLVYYFGAINEEAVGFRSEAFINPLEISTPGREALAPGYAVTVDGRPGTAVREVVRITTHLDFNSYLNRDGVWNIELRTATPDSFAGYRVLARDRVTIRRTITLNTNLTTTN